MIGKILISPNIDLRIKYISEILIEEKITNPHPDLLYIDDDQKYGIETAKKIREHLVLKPYNAKGRVIVLVSADKLTIEAQNSLLKTLEEPPESSVILLGATSENNLLQTILSRCQVYYLEVTKGSEDTKRTKDYYADIEKLLNSNIEQRFAFIEKLEDKEEFMKQLVYYFQNKLARDPSQVTQAKEALQAEKWQKAKGNSRAILEYLMLILPKNLVD